MAGIITVYFSRKGENYWNGSMKNLEKGNTRLAAEFVQKAVGGDLFEIETAKEYASAYRDCVSEAAAEFRADARPELKGYPKDLASYDTIFLGYPNWCGTCPMAVFTFLEHFDLTGKKIFPFCSNEGSGMGRSMEDLKKICRGAVIGEGLSIHGAETAASADMVSAWAKKSLSDMQ